MNWLITDKGNPDALALVDGYDYGLEPHYSRQSPGAPQFTRNGQNLVFMTADLLSVWVSFRPTPGKAVRPDGLLAWECALFRNENVFRDTPLRASTLIEEALSLTTALWGPTPQDRMVTFIKPDCTAAPVVGYCYRRAGWRRWGQASDGKPRFRSPAVAEAPLWYSWEWKGSRGGKLRASLEQGAVHVG